MSGKKNNSRKPNQKANNRHSGEEAQPAAPKNVNSVGSSNSVVTYNPNNKASSETYDPRAEYTITYLGKIRVPRTAENKIAPVKIREGEEMANFHDELAMGRYYTRRTLKAMDPKINPYTRAPIKEVRYYTATFSDPSGNGPALRQIRSKGGRCGRASLRNKRSLRRLRVYARL